tara:strand:+ start:171 stop:1799 length:1629 start_codon:yes stop_codon:yes gene_type:complete
MAHIHDEDEWSRFILICKPEQSGKTFVMIQNIIRDLCEPMEGKKIINIILCDNNLLLTKQTTERVKRDLMEYEVNGELYLEFSSHKRTDYHDAISVIGAVTTKPISNILCCTNGVRTDDIYTIINDLNRGEFTKDKLYFKIWLDEADKFTGYIDSTFKPLVDEFDNIQVYCITATPKKLFDRYNYMNVLPIENTTTEEYHGWGDNKLQLVEYFASAPEFARYVLKNLASEHVCPGSKWFIPAEHKKTSHEATKDICVEMGFAVFVVNGGGIRLTLPDKRLIIYPKDDELNKKIREIYVEHSLERFPLAITGNICIGRGISILTKDFMIDYGILSSCHNCQEASQNSGRLKGNIKDWDSYKPPTVFTTEAFDSVAREWEKKSRNLAELSFRKDVAGESTIITKAEFKTLGEDYDYIVHPELFLSFTEAKTFLATKGRDMARANERKPVKCHCKTTSIHRRFMDPFPKEHKSKVGYALSSRMPKKIEELTQGDRLIMDDSLPAPSFGISSSEKGNRYLILPIYETRETPPNKEKYQVRYIKFEK